MQRCGTETANLSDIWPMSTDAKIEIGPKRDSETALERQTTLCRARRVASQGCFDACCRMRWYEEEDKYELELLAENSEKF